MLFKWGKFIGAGGDELDWKIECDALSDEDWRCIANASVGRLGQFSGVAYVPTGGRHLAKAFEPYRVAGANKWLVVDDVWTTGASMRRHVAEMKIENWTGFVAFARGPLPSHVQCFANLSYETCLDACSSR